MIRVLAACAATAAATIALTAQGGLAGGASSPHANTVAPSCPHASYGADGNMGPLFCVIDNPVALRYFAPMAKRTFALGPNAAPIQVAAALVADYRHGGTEPILCSIYQLAQWRNHWSFGISAADQVGRELNFPSGWCAQPRFGGIH